MVAEWKKKGLEKLRERESEACTSYTKNPALTEKEQEAAFEKCIIDVEKLPLEKQLEFIQEVKECKSESNKAKTPKQKEEFEQWCYADIPTNIFAFKSDKNLSFESPSGPFICNELLKDGKPCGKSFSTKGNLDRHIDIIHHKLKPFLCPEFNDDGTPCGQAFPSNQSLQRHIDAVHRKLKPFLCPELNEDGTQCGKAFSTKGYLNEHIDTVHRKLKPFACNELLGDGNLCGQMFGAKSDLERHIDAVHRKLKPFMCNELREDGMVCGQAFALKQQLERHINEVHRKLKSFICDELLEDGGPCGQAFPSKINLQRHINAVHRKLKPFVCNELLEDGTPCGQTFTSKGNLEQHIDAVHRKLKPFICLELNGDGTPCGQTFKSKGGLDRHIDTIHRKLKQFICPELNDDGTPCGKTFGRKTDLNRHIREYHRQFRIYCSKCGKPFRRKNERDKHEAVCIGIDDAQIRRNYHIEKGGKVENTIVSIIEQYCEESNISTIRQKVLFDPVLGERKPDLHCDGLEGKRVAIDITTAETRQVLVNKWKEKRYQEYSDVDEFWVVVCSNTWDSKRCADLTNEIQRDPLYQDVYIYHWTELRDNKMMTIPPKIWKLLEIYEMCTLENKEECKKHWEKAKARFHTF